MSKLVRKILCALSAAAISLQFLGSMAMAVDTMADWVGQNTNSTNTTFIVAESQNNYGLISPTSVGGVIQSKINFRSSIEPTVTADEQQVYFSDPTLAGPTLSFATPLHMEGTITFSSDTPTEPNLLFGWYNSLDTRHRIGLGISNRADGATCCGGAIADHLRVDFGYGAIVPPNTSANRFYFVSPDGNAANTSPNSVVPEGTYPFTFDYQPPTAEDPNGFMQATVGTFFKTIQSLETTPYIDDTTTFDRFGLLQRTTTSSTNNPTATYNITFSNVDYTGGTSIGGALPGDFNSNGVVDTTDLGIWTTNFGAGTTLATGDADADGDADGNDFLIWQQNISAAPVAAIPEPAGIAMCVLAAVGLGLGVRRARQ